MNGPQHYKAAEKALEDLEAYYRGERILRDVEAAKTLVEGHSRLALVAATVNPRAPFEEWEKVLK